MYFSRLALTYYFYIIINKLILISYYYLETEKNLLCSMPFAVIFLKEINSWHVELTTCICFTKVIFYINFDG